MITETGHGVSKVRPKIHHWWNRICRDSVKSIAPFIWVNGVTGRPIYPVKNQFAADSCYGEMISMAIRNIIGGPELSAKSAYSQCFSTGGGVYLPNGQYQMLKQGLTTEVSVPSYIADGTTNEAFMEDITWRTPQMVQDCFTRAGFQLFNVDIDVNSVATAIETYGAVGMIIQGQNNGTWDSPMPLPPASSSNLWEHFMCFVPNVRPQTSTQQLDAYNSWGNQIGNNGIQIFDGKYFNSGYIRDIFAIVPFQFTPSIFLGCVGTQVSMLQQVLRSTGDFTFPYNTSLFGPLTFSAVCSYQKRNNIPETGYCGPLTCASLNALLGSVIAKQGKQE